MKEIRQQVEASFKCIELHDAVAVLPVMNALAIAITSEDTAELYSACRDMSKEQLLFAYGVLSSLGFCNSLNINVEEK